jgi:AcrR family transcriptional regulator
MHQQLQQELTEQFEKETSPSDRLHAVIRALLERVDEHPAFFRLVLGTHAMRSDTAAALDARLLMIGLEIAQVIDDLVAQGVQAGSFRPMASGRGAALIGQQIYGALWLRSTNPDPMPLDESAAEIWAFVLHGLGGPG